MTARKSRSYQNEEDRRFRLRDWLEQRISQPQYPGLVWIDREKRVFRIPWKHGGRHGWREEEDAKIFREWSEHTGASPRDIKQHKANFRCALNSLTNDVKAVPTLSKQKGDDAYRVYQFLPKSLQKRKTETIKRRTRPRMPKIHLSKSPKRDRNMMKSPTATNNASNSSQPAPNFPFFEENSFVNIPMSSSAFHQCSSPKFTSAILPPILTPKYPQPSPTYAPSHIRDYTFPFPGAREQDFNSSSYQTELSGCSNGKTAVSSPYNNQIFSTLENAIYPETCQNNSRYDAKALPDSSLPNEYVHYESDLKDQFMPSSPPSSFEPNVFPPSNERNWMENNSEVDLRSNCSLEINHSPAGNILESDYIIRDRYGDISTDSVISDNMEETDHLSPQYINLTSQRFFPPTSFIHEELFDPATFRGATLPDASTLLHPITIEPSAADHPCYTNSMIPSY